MKHDNYTVQEGEKLWPIIQIVRATHYDDLTEERVQQIVTMIDSWRITDADGRLIKRA